jgi:hypothetical protein
VCACVCVCMCVVCVCVCVCVRVSCVSACVCAGVNSRKSKQLVLWEIMFAVRPVTDSRSLFLGKEYVF